MSSFSMQAGVEIQTKQVPFCPNSHATPAFYNRTGWRPFLPFENGDLQKTKKKVFS